MISTLLCCLPRVCYLPQSCQPRRAASRKQGRVPVPNTKSLLGDYHWSGAIFRWIERAHSCCSCRRKLPNIMEWHAVGRVACPGVIVRAVAKSYQSRNLARLVNSPIDSQFLDRYALRIKHGRPLGVVPGTAPPTNRDSIVAHRDRYRLTSVVQIGFANGEH
jgi:hypothetical protein